MKNQQVHDSHLPAPLETQETQGIKRLIAFIVVAAGGLLLTLLTPVGDFFSKDAIRELAETLGWRGPLLILAAGTISPLFFLPRWPIAFAAGFLYGIAAGSLIANVASTLGAWLHFLLAKHLVAPTADRLKQKYPLLNLNVPREKAFLVFFLLRTFPLSNYVATNLFAGILKIHFPSFILSTFFGMIPSTVMYACWGRLLVKPGFGFYVAAALVLVLFIVTTYLAQKRFYPWLKRIAKNPQQRS